MIQADRIIEFLLHVLDNEDSEKVKACICIGLAKLVLSGMVDNERASLPRYTRLFILTYIKQALSSLVLLYVSPDTVDNQELRQCLSYFFPVFCYSAPSNQTRMQKVDFSHRFTLQKGWPNRLNVSVVHSGL